MNFKNVPVLNKNLPPQVFATSHDRDRVRSVLSDFAHVSSEFTRVATKALDQLCNGVMPSLRCDPSGFCELAS